MGPQQFQRPVAFANDTNASTCGLTTQPTQPTATDAQVDSFASSRSVFDVDSFEAASRRDAVRMRVLVLKRNGRATGQQTLRAVRRATARAQRLSQLGANPRS
jgi:hypothetical protein